MPTREPIADLIIPREPVKEIPTRVAITRDPKLAPKVVANTQNQAASQTNPNQAATSGNSQAADSAASAESVQLDPKASALARKEQAFRQREQALKQREKDLEAKLAKADQFDQFQTKISANDFSEVEKLGGNYEGYTKYLLEKQAGEDPTSQKFKALETELQDLKKRQEESSAEAFDETVRAYRTELTTFIDSNPDLSTVKKFKDTDHEGKEFTGVDVALQFILDSWKEDQEEVTVAEAAKLTKQFLAEKAKQWASLVDEPKQVDEAKPLPPPKPGVKTLTNQMQPTGNAQAPQKSLQHLSESERYAEARRRVLARRQQQGT